MAIDIIDRTAIAGNLTRDEDRRTKAYKDSKGFWTIGVGHCIETNGLTVSDEFVDQLLSSDISEALGAVMTAFPWYGKLDRVRLGVLVEMTFNEGIDHLKGFHKMLAALFAGDYDTAADEMLNSTWASQVGQRAVRLAASMRTGQ